MDFKLTAVLMLCGLGLIHCSKMLKRKYLYINQQRNWTDAQQYCREFHSDLATFESMDDIKQLNRPSFVRWGAWVGLWDHPKSWKGTMGNDPNSWRWSTTGSTSPAGYHNMDVDRVDFTRGKETCMVIGTNGKWTDSPCNSRLHFICYTANNDQKQYTLIEQTKTWEEAQSYCRVSHKDLAMIENDEENNKVTSVTKGGTVWIGLYREPWTWSDGSKNSFKNWRYRAPNNFGETEHCVWEVPDHSWDDASCHNKIPFICQEVTKGKQKTLVKLTVQTLANLSDPATQIQLLLQLEAHLRSKLSTNELKLIWRVRPHVQERHETKTKRMIYDRECDLMSFDQPVL